MVHQLICIPVAILFVSLDFLPSLQGDSGGKRFRFFFWFGCFASSHCLYLLLCIYSHVLEDEFQRMQNYLFLIAVDGLNAKQKCDLLIVLSN